MHFSPVWRRVFLCADSGPGRACNSSEDAATYSISMLPTQGQVLCVSHRDIWCTVCYIKYCSRLLAYGCTQTKRDGKWKLGFTRHGTDRFKLPKFVLFAHRTALVPVLGDLPECYCFTWRSLLHKFWQRNWLIPKLDERKYSYLQSEIRGAPRCDFDEVGSRQSNKNWILIAKLKTLFFS